MTVLDLPLEKQKAIAQRRGVAFEVWVEETKRILRESDEHFAKFKTITFSSQEEAEKAGYNLDKWRQPLIPFPA